MKLCIKTRTSFLFFFFIVSAAFAQTPSVYSIKGVVTDSLTKKPIEYVTVGLKATDGKAVKSALTSSKGAFSFDKVASGKYNVTLVSIGYQKKTIAVDATRAGNAEVSLGTILLTSATNQLSEVSITADRPIVKQEVDRISYDVQADPENKVNTVLDMLRKMPLVSLDAEDNIEVKGSSSFKVLINGRPSALVARSPKDVFKSMPASSIQKIEVITTPPAKYDGEGLAGIINIITNKKVDQGYNGSLSARYSFPYGPGANAQLTVKGGKFGFSAYGGASMQNAPSTGFSSSRLTIPTQTSLLQTGSRENDADWGYTNMELSYEIDSLNLITAEAGFNKYGGTSLSDQLSRQLDGNGTLTQGYRLMNTGDFNWGGYEVGVNYQLGFKRNKEQLMTASYKYNSNADDMLSELLTSENFSYPLNDYRQENNSGTDEQTFQLDYTHPAGKKLNIEGGLKGILRGNFSDYEYQSFVPGTGEFVVDEDRSNKFNYQQDVYSFYNSYQLKLDKWGVKAGLRLERTVVDADFTSSAQKFDTDYNNFIPSVSVQRKLKNNSSLNLGYTQRIQRPSIWQLNPFVDESNPQFIRSGNSNLKPVLNHNFELSYSMFKKGSVNMGLSYGFANNTIQYVSRLDGNVTRTTFENIGSSKNLGFNASTNRQITKDFNINVNGRLSYMWIEGFVNDKFYENDGIQGNAYLYAGYKLPQDFRLGFNAGFYSAWINLQGKSNPYYYTSASLSKEFLKKKATLSASVSNPFQKFRNWKNDTSTPDFIQTSSSQNYYRNFNVNFNYRFGQLKESIKKNRRGISNDDVAGKSTGN